MGHSVNGRNLTGVICAWMIIKSIVNLIIGFSIGNVVVLAVYAVFAYLLIKGTKTLNYAAALVLVIIVIANIKGNLSGIGLNKNLIYLAEAVVDIICAWQFVTNKDIKAFFGQDD